VIEEAPKENKGFSAESSETEEHVVHHPEGKTTLMERK